MVDQFNKVQATNDYVADIAALKSHILSKASLYDGKDKQVLVPKTRNELHNNQHLQEPADDEEAFYDVEQYSTYQHELADYETATYTAFRTNTSNTPGGRIPDHVWRLMTDENRQSWASMPHDIRSQIIAKQNHYGSGRPPDSRSSGRFGNGRNPGRGGGRFGRGRGSGRSRPPERRAYSHVSDWLTLPDDERHVNWTEQSYPPNEDTDDDKTDTVGGIIAKTHRLSVHHQEQLEDHKARLNILANTTKSKLPSKTTPSAATKKDITKAIAKSLKKNLP